jgi:hypothetical protein
MLTEDKKVLLDDQQWIHTNSLTLPWSKPSTPAPTHYTISGLEKNNPNFCKKNIATPSLNPLTCPQKTFLIHRNPFNHIFKQQGVVSMIHVFLLPLRSTHPLVFYSGSHASL